MVSHIELLFFSSFFFLFQNKILFSSVFIWWWWRWIYSNAQAHQRCPLFFIYLFSFHIKKWFWFATVFRPCPTIITTMVCGLVFFFFLFINAGDKPTKRALSLYKIRDLYYYIIFVYIDSLNFDGNHLIYMCGDCCCCCCCRMLSQRRRNRPPPVCHALKVLRV